MTILTPFVTFFWPKNIKLDQNKPKFVNSKKRKKNRVERSLQIAFTTKL